MGVEEGNSFTACARRLSAAFVLDGDKEPPSSDFERVQSGLTKILFARFHSSLGEADLCEICDESTARLLNESRRQGRALDNAAGWLRTTAVNLALDKLKSPRMEPLDDHEPTIKDEFEARLLERLTSDDQVARALQATIEGGEDIVVRIVCDYLDLAEEMPGSPSTREVAERCGYSHTTVGEALKRFGHYLK
jgi:hypothetical protein